MFPSAATTYRRKNSEISSLLKFTDMLRFVGKMLTESEFDMASITTTRALHDRLKMYADIHNRTVRDVVDEALTFWMDTIGAADIFLETGVETGPQYPTGEQEESLPQVGEAMVVTLIH